MKRDQNEPVQVKCTQCGERAIVSLPACPTPDGRGRCMVFGELLDEGGSY